MVDTQVMNVLLKMPFSLDSSKTGRAESFHEIFDGEKMIN